jgi:hypothetical protein
MRLRDNQQLYDYLVAMSTKLNNRDAVKLSQDVLAASQMVATIPITEFLGESRIALRRVENEQTVLTDEECSELRDVIRQLDEALARC